MRTFNYNNGLFFFTKAESGIYAPFDRSCGDYFPFLAVSGLYLFVKKLRHRYNISNMTV